MSTSATLPHLPEALDYDALTETPRDVLHRAEHELAHQIQARVLDHAIREGILAAEYEMEGDLDWTRLHRVRAELARREAMVDPLAAFTLLHALLRREVAA